METFVTPHTWVAGEQGSSLYLNQYGADITHVKEAHDRPCLLTGVNATSIGSPCVQDTSGDDRMSVITTAGHAGPVWIAMEALSPTATGWFRPAGIVPVKITGTAAVVGDTLQTSATPGSAEVGSTNAFAEVLKVVSSTLVEARFLSGSGGGGGTLTTHDHTSTAGQGGVLTGDQHDGFSEYDEISAPSSPAANKLRLYVTDDSGTTVWRAKDSAGAIRTLGDAVSLQGDPIQTAIAPSNGDVLTWDSTPGEWTAAAPAGGGGGGGSYIPAVTLAPPTLADFAWDNQSTATATTEHSSIRFKVPASATNQWHVLHDTLGALPQTITVGIVPIRMQPVQYQNFGLCVRESVGAKLQGIGIWYEGGAWNVRTVNMTTSTSFSATQNAQVSPYFGPAYFFQCEQTAAGNRTWRVSPNGLQWTDWVVTTFNDFTGTPNQAGFWAASMSSSLPLDVAVIHWSVV